MPQKSAARRDPEYIYPPYPAQVNKVHPRDLTTIERSGQWVCQRKFGGSRAVIRIHKAAGRINLFDRHGGEFATLALTDTMRECLLSLDLEADKVYFLDGEFLDKKAKSAITGRQMATDTIVLFDVIYAGEYMTQTDQMTRLAMLADICHNPTRLEPKRRALAVCVKGGSNLWMAETFEDDFEFHFYEFVDYDRHGRDEHPEIEGVILRQRNFCLTDLGTKQYALKGQVLRCRKPAKSRSF